MAQCFQQSLDFLFQGKTGMIGCQGNFHFLLLGAIEARGPVGGRASMTDAIMG